MRRYPPAEVDFHQIVDYFFIGLFLHYSLFPSGKPFMEEAKIAFSIAKTIGFHVN
jgi:hypothetical protein